MEINHCSNNTHYYQHNSLKTNENKDCQDFGVMLNAKQQESQNEEVKNNIQKEQKNFSASKNVENNKISTYADIGQQAFEDYMNGKIEFDIFVRITAASLNSALSEAYQCFEGNPFDGMKRIQQGRNKADTANKIETEINKDIAQLNHNFNLGMPIGMTQEEHQRLHNKAKDFLFEILQELKA
ncbi:hypothetical protein LS70_007935 [Helicobacter sp. MIT 11-5569]|uniref:hypothetical protein n=1 Tax=Helicobacter sp. MIT 11-5569 TaxID=1548151 RepID=UPI000AF453F1|nr:hypothetical protein [Helicobacter sp. MIT 11-5569]TLD81429.1 hypothetical protein LS70_007935 [Helicobacter sp. MIT 11-5569]